MMNFNRLRDMITPRREERAPEASAIDRIFDELKDNTQNSGDKVASIQRLLVRRFDKKGSLEPLLTIARTFGLRVGFDVDTQDFADAVDRHLDASPPPRASVRPLFLALREALSDIADDVNGPRRRSDGRQVRLRETLRSSRRSGRPSAPGLFSMPLRPRDTSPVPAPQLMVDAPSSTREIPQRARGVQARPVPPPPPPQPRAQPIPPPPVALQVAEPAAIAEANVLSPEFVDASGRRWLDPAYVVKPLDFMKAFAQGVRDGQPGTRIEARAYGDAFGKPVHLWTHLDGNIERERLNRGDKSDRFWSYPLNIIEESPGVWSAIRVTGHDTLQNIENFTGADAMYMALEAAARVETDHFIEANKLVLRQSAPNHIQNVRNAVAQRLEGGPGSQDSVYVQCDDARAAAMLLGWDAVRAYSLKWDEGRTAIAPPLREGVRTLDIFLDPEKGWQVIDVPSDTALRHVDDLALHYQPQRANVSEPVSVEDALALLGELRHPNQPRSTAHAIRALLDARPVSASEPSDYYVTQVREAASQAIDEFLATASRSEQQGAAVRNYLNKRSAFEAVHPFSPFDSDDQATVVHAYLARLEGSQAFASQDSSRELGRVFNFNVRTWKQNLDTGIWETNRQQAHFVPNANGAVDLLHEGAHYTTLDTRHLRLDKDMAEGAISARDVAALRIEAGGDGDCLFFAFACGANFLGYNDVLDARSRGDHATARRLVAEKTGHPNEPATTDDEVFADYRHYLVSTMRGLTVNSWRDRIFHAKRGQGDLEARALALELSNAAQIEGIALLEEAREAIEQGVAMVDPDQVRSQLLQALQLAPDARETFDELMLAVDRSPVIHD